MKVMQSHRLTAANPRQPSAHSTTSLCSEARAQNMRPSSAGPHPPAASQPGRARHLSPQAGRLRENTYCATNCFLVPFTRAYIPVYTAYDGRSVSACTFNLTLSSSSLRPCSRVDASHTQAPSTLQHVPRAGPLRPSLGAERQLFICQQAAVQHPPDALLPHEQYRR